MPGKNNWILSWINVGELQRADLSKPIKTEQQNLSEPARRNEAKPHPAAGKWTAPTEIHHPSHWYSQTVKIEGGIFWQCKACLLSFHSQIAYRINYKEKSLRGQDEAGWEYQGRLRAPQTGTQKQLFPCTRPAGVPGVSCSFSSSSLKASATDCFLCLLMTVGGKSAFEGTVLIILGSTERTKDPEMGKKKVVERGRKCVWET